MKIRNILGTAALAALGALGITNAQAGDWINASAYGAMKEGRDTYGVVRTLGSLTPVPGEYSGRAQIDFFGEFSGNAGKSGDKDADPLDLENGYMQIIPNVRLTPDDWEVKAGIVGMSEHIIGVEDVYRGGVFAKYAGDEGFVRARVFPGRAGPVDEARADLLVSIDVGDINLCDFAILKHDLDTGDGFLYNELFATYRTHTGVDPFAAVIYTHDIDDGSHSTTGVIGLEHKFE